MTSCEGVGFKSDGAPLVSLCHSSLSSPLSVSTMSLSFFFLSLFLLSFSFLPFLCCFPFSVYSFQLHSYFFLYLLFFLCHFISFLMLFSLFLPFFFLIGPFFFLSIFQSYKHPLSMSLSLAHACTLILSFSVFTQTKLISKLS